MENEGLYLAAKAALKFIESIEGYENCVTAVNLRRELQSVEQSVQADVCLCSPLTAYETDGVGGARICCECGGTRQ